MEGSEVKFSVASSASQFPFDPRPSPDPLPRDVFPSLSREIECLIDRCAERLSRVVNMSKKSYKLTYFKARGRGEFIRLVFLIAGVEFEDHQVDFHEEWPLLKASKYLSRVLMFQLFSTQLFSTVY